MKSSYQLVLEGDFRHTIEHLTHVIPEVDKDKVVSRAERQGIWTTDDHLLSVAKEQTPLKKFLRRFRNERNSN